MYKGQIVTLDLVFALTIALSIIFILNSYWGSMQKNMENEQTQLAVEKAAYLSGFYLTASQGAPLEWNRSNAQLIGLANQMNVIDVQRFNELMQISNGSISSYLGIPEFNVFINLTTASGTTINSTGARQSNSSIAVVVPSFVSFNNNLSILYVTVWK